MLRRLLYLIVLLALPGLAGAQSSSFIQYYPSAGLATMTGTATATTSTVPILIPDGTVTAPGFAFSAQPTVGLYRSGTSFWVIGGPASAKKIAFDIASGYIRLYNAGVFSFGSSSDAEGIPDLMLTREAAATLQLGVDAATATAQAIKGADSTGANVTGGNLTLRAGAGTAGNATGGQLILGGGVNAGSGERGAVAIEDGGTKPTCAVGLRGSVWYDAGGAGVADTSEMCVHKSDNSYAWVALATPIP